MRLPYGATVKKYQRDSVGGHLTMAVHFDRWLIHSYAVYIWAFGGRP